MNITQTFYDDLAPQYDKLFAVWNAATQEQASTSQSLWRRSKIGLEAW